MTMLVTLDKVKELLGIAPGDTTEDAYLTYEIETMSSIVEEYCQRHFLSGSETEEFDLWEEDYLYLLRYPLTSVSALSLDGVSLDLGTNPSPLLIERSAGRIALRSGTFDGCETISITYDGGYAETPAEIQRVVTDLVQSRYYNKGISDPTRRIRSESIPDVANYIYERSYAFDENALLGAYTFILDKWRSVKAFSI